MTDLRRRRKPGPAGKGPREQITVRLPIGLKERLDAVSATTGKAVNDLVATCVEAHVDELEGKSGVSAQAELEIDFRKTA